MKQLVLILLCGTIFSACDASNSQSPSTSNGTFTENGTGQEVANNGTDQSNGAGGSANPPADDPPDAPAINEETFLIKNNQYSETITDQPFVGNGYLGLRVASAGTGFWVGKSGNDLSLPWPEAENTPRFSTAMVEGFYGQDQTRISTIPYWQTITVGDANELYDPQTLEATSISEYEQTMDLRNGVLKTSLIWTTKANNKIRLEWTTFIHRTKKHLAAVQLKATPIIWTGNMRVRSVIDLRAARRGRSTVISEQSFQNTTGLGAQASVRSNSTNNKASVVFVMDAPKDIGNASAIKSNDESGLSWSFIPGQTQSYVFTKYVGVSTSYDDEFKGKPAVPVNQLGTDESVNKHAESFAVNAQKFEGGFNALLAESSAAWNKLWDESNIVAENDRFQKIVNAAQYQLLSSLYPGSRFSIGPSGLSSTSYDGMVFWDAETWMYPYMLLTRPDYAKQMVSYRFDTLNNARATATRELGANAGAKYSWVSGTGIEPGMADRHQVHLQGDIALAQYQYFAATGDMEWLKTEGYPVLSNIANFYAARSTLSDDGLSYSLRNVSGPDEYTHGANDAAFTNGIALRSFEFATRAAQLTEQVPAPKWKELQDKLIKPIVHPSLNIHLQHANTNPFSGQKIKQADTVLLNYPTEYPMPKERAANDLRHYFCITDVEGPAMTDAVHAVIAAQLGRNDFARFLGRSYETVLGKQYHFNETRVLRPSAGQAGPANVFTTAAGGFLQAVGFGATGYRFREDVIPLSPILPEQIEGEPVKRLYFGGLQWRGRVFNVDIGTDNTWVTLDKGEPAIVEAEGQRFALTTAKPLKLATRKAVSTDSIACNPTATPPAVELKL